MSQEYFKGKKFRDPTRRVIMLANGIIDEYMADGYDLTLRQLYYQFVARDLIPNSQSEYNKLGSILSDARLAGLVDWDAIKDRTRAMDENWHCLSPQSLMAGVARDYAIDLRSDQDCYIEVWVEKEALVGIIEKACQEVDVPWFACRGYVSLTAMYEASKRFVAAEEDAKETIIFQLGDHDPSGIDMTRDIQDRLNMFGSTVRVNRIALNMDQVDEYNPPSNPAKLTDSRCGGYMDRFGDESWELDALDPHILTELIKTSVAGFTDPDKIETKEYEQEEQREILQKITIHWDKVKKLLAE